TTGSLKVSSKMGQLHGAEAWFRSCRPPRSTGWLTDSGTKYSGSKLELRQGDAESTRNVPPALGSGSASTRRDRMAIDTLLVYVGVYDSVGAAEADYEVIKDLHTEAGLIDGY